MLFSFLFDHLQCYYHIKLSTLIYFSRLLWEPGNKGVFPVQPQRKAIN